VQLKLGKGLVLLVLLYKPEAELGLELGPGGEVSNGLWVG
jgi:hypothetical protein